MRQFAIACDQFDRSSAWDRFQADPYDDARLHGFSDANRTRFLLGPPEIWLPAFDILLGTPQPRAGRLRLFAGAVSRPWWWVAVAFTLAALAVMAVWWSGEEKGSHRGPSRRLRRRPVLVRCVLDRRRPCQVRGDQLS